MGIGRSRPQAPQWRRQRCWRPETRPGGGGCEAVGERPQGRVGAPLVMGAGAPTCPLHNGFQPPTSNGEVCHPRYRTYPCPSACAFGNLPHPRCFRVPLPSYWPPQIVTTGRWESPRTVIAGCGEPSGGSWRHLQHLGQKIIATKILGTVKWFNPKNGYGFIKRNDTKEDVFVHHTAIKKKDLRNFYSMAGGDTVEFDLVEGDKGVKAANVTSPGGVPVHGSQFGVDQNQYGHHFWHRNAQERSLRYYPRQEYRSSCFLGNFYRG